MKVLIYGYGWVGRSMLEFLGDRNIKDLADSNRIATQEIIDIVNEVFNNKEYDVEF